MKFSHKHLLVAAGTMLLVTFFVGTLATLIYPSMVALRAPETTSAQSLGTFIETFNGAPTTPAKFIGTTTARNWDVFVHHRDFSPFEKLPEVQAHHDANCSAPLDPSSRLLTHTVTNIDDHVFNCRDHVMTTINGGEYGAIYLTPNQIVDFTNQTATIRFDVTTLRTSGRDWIDFWITPMDDNLMGPLEAFLPGLQGEPRRGIQFRMGDRGSATPFRTIFTAHVVRNHSSSNIPRFEIALEEFMSPSPVRRDTFEVTISKNRFKAWMPQYNKALMDTEISGGLDWSTGIVQLAHHSYNPYKGCADANHQNFNPCGPDTWHWDNISISPSRPFAMIKPAVDRADILSPAKITLPQAVPESSYLRFWGFDARSSAIQISYDGGRSWQNAREQLGAKTENHLTYFMPIPAGVREIMFRGQQDMNWGAYVQNVSVWSMSNVNVVQPSASSSVVMSISPSSLPSSIASVNPSPSVAGLPGTSPSPIVSGSRSFLEVFAAGQPSQNIGPTLKVIYKKNNVSQEVWRIENILANASVGTFQRYTNQLPETTQIQQLRFVFDNDQNTSQGDRNLRIQKVILDGRTYLPTEENTLAEGSWNAASSCGLGFKRSEWLHCNGYMIFGL